MKIIIIIIFIVLIVGLILWMYKKRIKKMSGGLTDEEQNIMNWIKDALSQMFNLNVDDQRITNLNNHIELLLFNEEEDFTLNQNEDIEQYIIRLNDKYRNVWMCNKNIVKNNNYDYEIKNLCSVNYYFELLFNYVVNGDERYDNLFVDNRPEYGNIILVYRLNNFNYDDLLGITENNFKTLGGNIFEKQHVINTKPLKTQIKLPYSKHSGFPTSRNPLKKLHRPIINDEKIMDLEQPISFEDIEKKMPIVSEVDYTRNEDNKNTTKWADSFNVVRDDHDYDGDDGDDDNGRLPRKKFNNTGGPGGNGHDNNYNGSQGYSNTCVLENIRFLNNVNHILIECFSSKIRSKYQPHNVDDFIHIFNYLHDFIHNYNSMIDHTNGYIKVETKNKCISIRKTGSLTIRCYYDNSAVVDILDNVVKLTYLDSHHSCTINLDDTVKNTIDIAISNLANHFGLHANEHKTYNIDDNNLNKIDNFIKSVYSLISYNYNGSKYGELLSIPIIVCIDNGLKEHSKNDNNKFLAITVEIKNIKHGGTYFVGDINQFKNEYYTFNVKVYNEYTNIDGNNKRTYTYFNTDANRIIRPFNLVLPPQLAHGGSKLLYHDRSKAIVNSISSNNNQLSFYEIQNKTTNYLFSHTPYVVLNDRIHELMNYYENNNTSRRNKMDIRIKFNDENNTITIYAATKAVVDMTTKTWNEHCPDPTVFYNINAYGNYDFNNPQTAQNTIFKNKYDDIVIHSLFEPHH